MRGTIKDTGDMHTVVGCTSKSSTSATINVGLMAREVASIGVEDDDDVKEKGCEPNIPKKSTTLEYNVVHSSFLVAR